MNSETVEALHAVTSELKACNDERDGWLAQYGRSNSETFDDPQDHGVLSLMISRAEAEMIFTARRTAIEAKLKDLGWSKTTRVDSATPAGSG